MLTVTPAITIAEVELRETFIQASGPGGQNVNKVATAVQLRFDVRGSPSLPDDVRLRLLRLAGRRMTVDGVLVIKASRFRTQERNREDAMSRLVALIRAAAEAPVSRQATRPPRAARETRLAGKRRRGAIKQSRRSAARQDE